MKRILIFGFLLMGFTFTVTQGLLIRELLVAFFGNELSIGLILGNWLILEAVGSGLLGRLADRWGKKPSSFATLQILFAFFLPLCLFAAYASRSIVGAMPGEGVGLLPIFWSSFIILTPLALVDGAMFAFGSRTFAILTGNEVPSIGKVYVYESLGAIVGGITFTYLLIPFLYSFQIVIVLSGLNLLSAALLLAYSRLHKRKQLSLTPSLIIVIVLLIVGFGFSISPALEEVQHWANGQRWVGLDLIYSENSVYGNVAAIQRENQYTFYADGIPILTAPVPDVVLSEEIVHLPMLFINQPERALVLSGGMGGVLIELSKYSWQAIDYAELDPLLIEAVEDFPTPLTLNELSDPRLKIEHVDGRLLVKRKGWSYIDRYDLVIVNLPYPSTLQLNRYYTVEFFQMVQGIVSNDGILVIKCPGTLSYMSDELRDLNRMLYSTLQQVFSHVRPIPGDLTLWLASPSGKLTTAPVETLVERWEIRDLETRLLTAPYIRLKLGHVRLDWFWQSLDEGVEHGKTLVNHDLHPVGLFYGLSYWHALFSPQLTRVFSFIGRLNLWVLGLPIMGCSLLLLVILKRTNKGKENMVPIVITATGFAGMATDLVIIFAFQSLYGYVYHWIGLFITTFMAGLTLGGFLLTRGLSRIKRENRALLGLELAMVFFWIVLPITLNTLYVHVDNPLVFTSTQGILLMLNAVGGFLVGSQFPLANKLILRGGEEIKGSVGLLYASDLAGAFLGSIAVSVVLIPVLGIIKTCLLVVILKFGSLMLVAALPFRS